jgi:hypothetical protein
LSWENGPPLSRVSSLTAAAPGDIPRKSDVHMFGLTAVEVVDFRLEIHAKCMVFD